MLAVGGKPFYFVLRIVYLVSFPFTFNHYLPHGFFVPEHCKIYEIRSVVFADDFHDDFVAGIYSDIRFVGQFLFMFTNSVPLMYSTRLRLYIS